MNKRVIWIHCITVLVFFILIGLLNSQYKFINIPNDMRNYQFSIVTITSVFAGFSFSVLGLLLSLQATDPMKRFSETNIISDNCKLITQSIVYLLLSFFISLYFILGLNQVLLTKEINSILFIVGIGYLFCGVLAFSFSVRQMVKLMNYIFKDSKLNAEKKVNAYLKEKEKINHSKNCNEIDEQNRNCFL